MNEEERKQYCEDKIQEIKALDVEIIKSDIDDIMKASQDSDGNRMIETVDKIVDEYFEINFKKNKEQNFKSINVIEDIKIFDIGNGLKGFEYKNKRFTQKDDLIKYLEELNVNENIIDKIQYDV